MKKTGAVLIASGMSDRMAEFKPMLPFGESTIAIHMVHTLKKMELDPIVVVTGYRAVELEEHLSHMSVRFIKNEQYRNNELFDDIKLGVKAIAKECERIAVVTVDVPAIMPETMRQMLMIDAKLVRSVYNGEPGYPIILSCELLGDLEHYKEKQNIGRSIKEINKNDRSLAAAIESFGSTPVTNVEVEDAGVCRAVVTKKDYEELLEWNYHRGAGYPIHPHTKVRLMASKAFFGPGTYELLELVNETGSLQEACSRMNLSYSKGSRMVKEAERQLGFSITRRWAGGSGGGGSRLTEEGEWLLENYRRMAAEVQACTEQIYQKYFGKGFGC